MNDLTLLPIALAEDKSSPMFDAAECQQLLTMYDDFYAHNGFNAPWIGYFVLSGEKVVGSCGFVGQPNNGAVELAYWTFSAYEGRGIASYACKELVSLAYDTDPALTITAKTAPERNASTKVLERNGFIVTGMVQDHEIGDAWLWTHQRTD